MRFRTACMFAAITTLWPIVSTVDAQLGILTSAIGTGQLNRAHGSTAEWLIGETIEVADEITTDANSYAMIFFVSGLGGTDIEFEGTIVVEIDQGSVVKIRRGGGRRAPIDIHVTKGRARAFFDAREHKDYILLSTPLARLEVIGSIVYATHDLPDAPGSVLGSFDSDCQVTLKDGAIHDLSQLQKVVVQPDGSARTLGITSADQNSWESMPDLNLAAAFSHRSAVRLAYADRTWVGEYVTGGERLENVAREGTSNIPSQEPEVVSTAQTVITRTTTVTPRTQPRLRAASTGRTVGDDNGGIGRETLASRRRPR